MSIRYRLLSGFLVVLCLTLGVATVGWLALGGYARRVNIAAQGQDVEVLIDTLAVAAERAIASGDVAQLSLNQPLSRVQKGIDDLRQLTGPDAGALDRVQTSIDSFKQDLSDYAAQQRERTALVASRMKLIDQFDAVTADIAAAQSTALREAADTAKAGRAQLITAATGGQLVSFLSDAIAGVREAVARFGYTNNPEDLKAVTAALAKVQMISTGISRRPEAAEAASHLLTVVAAARDAIKDPETANTRLPSLAAAMTTDVQAINAGLNNRLSAIITQYEDEEFKLGAATTLREAALQVNTLSLRAKLAEQALVRDHDLSAAKTITETAGEIEKASQELLYRVTQPATEQKIRSLMAQIADYQKGLGILLAAQEKQATLLQHLNAATTEAIGNAETLTNAQLLAMEHEHGRADLLLGLGVGTAMVIGLVLAFLIGRSITRPIASLAGVMGRLAGGDKSVEIPGRDRRDELREVAAAVAVFRENAIAMDRMVEERAAAEARSDAEKRQAMIDLAGELDATVSSVVESIGTSAHSLQSTAATLTTTAEDTQRQASAAADASGVARLNVQAVAAAAEELSASIGEISRQAMTSAEVAARAVTGSNQTNARVNELTRSAEKIETVIALIQEIASRTNLLALNATIEAARAGTAGAGFAVVASEVKQLANQTASATAEISVQIGAIQEATRDSVRAIAEISHTIEEMGAITAAISTAVEQQGLATNEIAQNIQEASAGTSQASSNITDVSAAARQTGSAADSVLSAAATLARDSDHLRGQVREFLQKVVGG